MKLTLGRVVAFSVGLLALGNEWLRADETNTPAGDILPVITLEPQDNILKNRIGISYQMGLNISVDFRKFGGLALSQPGPAAGSAINRNYDNGYNRVDSSTNAGGVTWNWGYQNGQSVQGDSLVLQSYSTPANASSNGRQEDPQHGFEAFYQRELRRETHWRLGAEAAAGYTFISITDRSTLKNTAYRTNDAFALNGTLPPLPPYQGTFQGPGDLIGSTPGRTTDVLARTATIAGSRSVDADVFMFRLGPYLEVPLNQRVSLFANAGLALIVGHTEFNFRERVTISDPANDINLTSAERSGSGSKTDFLVGGYGGGGLAYALTREVSLFAGARYQAAGRAINHEKGKESILDLGQSILVTVGVTYAF
jgi:opacity protein-like surface antigen